MEHTRCAKMIVVSELMRFMTALFQARIDRFHVYQSKDLPVKQRDVALLKDMYNQLQEQAAKKKKGPTVPDDMTFELLEAAWAGLERENGECEAAMTRELER